MTVIIKWIHVIKQFSRLNWEESDADWEHLSRKVRVLGITLKISNQQLRLHGVQFPHFQLKGKGKNSNSRIFSMHVVCYIIICELRFRIPKTLYLCRETALEQRREKFTKFFLSNQSVFTDFAISLKIPSNALQRLSFLIKNKIHTDRVCIQTQ